jgi:hypothetical protein
MTKIVVNFEGETWEDIRLQICAAANPGAAFSPPRLVVFDENDGSKPNGVDEPEPPAATTAVPAPKRSHRKAQPLAATIAAASTATEVAPPPLATELTVPRELPTLEALKSLVTVAVRAAQKNEGPKTILEILPEFKKTTGLDFVMNAKEEHREALFDLVETAGLIPA